MASPINSRSCQLGIPECGGPIPGPKNEKAPLNERGFAFVVAVRSGSEAIVQTHLDRMSVEIAAGHAAEIGFRAQPEVQILNLGRPVRHERVLDAGTDRIAEVVLRIGNSGRAIML